MNDDTTMHYMALKRREALNRGECPACGALDAYDSNESMWWCLSDDCGAEYAIEIAPAMIIAAERVERED